MILITLAFVFLAIFCLAYGIYVLSDTMKQAAVRRRLHVPSGENVDELDPNIMRAERLGFGDGVGLTQRIDRLMVQAGLTMTVGNFLATSIFLAVGVGIVGFMVSRQPILAVPAGLVAGSIPFLVVYYKRHKRMRAFDELFPEGLDLMVNALRAGFALGGAIQLVAEEAPDPVGTEFRILFEEQKLGLDIKQAMYNLAQRMSSTDVGYFTTAVIVQRDTGGNLAEVLEKISHVIRDRYRILGEVRTFTAQGRLSGAILGAMPILLAMILTFLSPGYLNLLIKDPFGKILLIAAGSFQLLGFLSIRKIVDIKV